MRTDRFTTIPLSALILACLLCVITSTSFGVTRGAIDFQFIFFGNTQGRSVEFQPTDEGSTEISFSPIWKLPEIINRFTRGYETKTLIVNVGNNEREDAPVSYLLEEPIFEHLRRFCRPQVDAVGPGDFARSALINKVPTWLFGRLWSNVLQPAEQPFFLESNRHRLSGHTFVFGCFIAPELLVDSFISSVPQLEVEDPSRAWRRFSLQIEPDDIPVLICHMPAPDFRRLQQTVRQPSILLWVPPEQPAKTTPTILPNTHHRHVDVLPPADEAPLMLFAHRRSGGEFDIRSRHPRYRSVSHPQGHFDFDELGDRLRHAARQSLHVIPTPGHRSTVIARWRPDLLADLVNQVFRSDLTLVQLLGDHTWKGRVIYPETLFSSLPACLVREYEFSGHDLKLYLERVFQSASPGRLGVAGGKLAFLAGKVRNLQGRNLPVLPQLSYRLSLDSSLYSVPSLHPESYGGKRVGSNGHTFWSIALQQLPLLDPGKGLGQ